MDGRLREAGERDLKDTKHNLGLPGNDGRPACKGGRPGFDLKGKILEKGNSYHSSSTSQLWRSQ